MEESGSSRTAIGGIREEPSDWKAQFTPDLRPKIVQKILGFLALPPDSPSHMIKLVENFEENAFSNARSKEEYKQTISKRLKLIDNRSSHGSASVSFPQPGLNQNSLVAGEGQSSTLKKVYQAPSEFSGDSVGQGMQSNISAYNWRDIPGTQPSQKEVYQQYHHQQSQNQFLNQPNVGNLHIEDIHSGHHHQQQQHIASQSNPFQIAQNQTLPTESRQTPFTERSSTAVFQPNQLVAQGDNIGQQLSPFQKTMPNTYLQHDRLQRNYSCLQQQHRVIGPELKTMNMKSYERSAHILQVEDTSLQPKVGQRVQLVNNFHQLFYSPKQSKKEAMHQRPETLAAMVTPQIVNNHQNVLPSQKTLAEVSSAWSPVPSLVSATPSEQANMAGLNDQTYQKFLCMKKKYLPWLTYSYKILNEKYQKPPIPEAYKKKISRAESLIKFLSLSRGDLVRCSMEILESYKQAMKQFLNSCKLENLFSAQQYTQLQPPGGQSQLPQLQQHCNGEQNFHPLNLILTSKSVGPSPLSSSQEVVLSSQPNMMNSVHSVSLMELKQQNAPSSLQHAARPEGHDIAHTLQTKHFHDSMGRSFDSAYKLQQKNSVINTFPHPRQLKHQITQSQNVRQHMQPQLSQKKMKYMQMAKIQSVTTSSMLQQNPFISQMSDFSHRTLPATPRHFQDTSQMSQHSSIQVYQKNLPLSKSGTPLYSANSPSITSSPPSPLTPFSIPVDFEKHQSDASPLLISENFGHPQLLQVAQSELSASILLNESASPNDNQQSSPTKEPLERLLKAVKSLSPKALSTCVSEISSALKMVDVIVGAACNDSGADVDENLVSETRCCIHRRNFKLHCGCFFEAKMKRKTNAIALDETEILKQSTNQIWDIDSSEASRIKRCRIEPSNTLLDEIKCINQQLLETVIDLDSTEDPAALDAGEGKIVRCVYRAVALDENLKMQFASQMLPLPLWLFVPARYPNASPVILGRLSFDGSCKSKESIDLSEKTRSRFSISLRKLSEPMSLAEMAMTWDNCARTVLLECAQLVGGGCFSTKYGKWENCATA